MGQRYERGRFAVDIVKVGAEERVRLMRNPDGEVLITCAPDEVKDLAAVAWDMQHFIENGE